VWTDGSSWSRLSTRGTHERELRRFEWRVLDRELLAHVIDVDVEKAKSTALALQTDIGDALEDLRDLARGIYPPLLADKGLVAALESQARRSLVPFEIEGDGIGRYPREVEAAVYFSCLEALQNIAKYAQASRVSVRISDGNDRVRFEVVDDGVGFDAGEATYGTGLQGIADRLSALGREMDLRSTPGAGTSVRGELPIMGAPER